MELTSSRGSGIGSRLRQAEVDAKAPDYIRASALPLHVKVALWRSEGWGPLLAAEDPTISVEAAKRELAQRSHLDNRAQASPEGS